MVEHVKHSVRFWRASRGPEDSASGGPIYAPLRLLGNLFWAVKVKILRSKSNPVPGLQAVAANTSARR